MKFASALRFLLSLLPAWFFFLTTVNAANFTGPGISVVCPAADYAAQPCIIAPVDGNSQACLSQISCIATSQITQNDTYVTIPLKCSCLESANCPDTCQAMKIPEFSGPVNKTFDPAFQGPGYAVCQLLSLSMTTNPSLCTLVDTGTCTQSEKDSADCTSANIPDIPQGFTTLSLPLPCNCFAFVGCESACVFKKFDQINATKVPLTLNVTGPGTLTCPLEDFGLVSPQVSLQSTQNTCLPTVIPGCVSNSTCDVNVTQLGQLVDSTLKNISLPFPCECLQATNCPATCTFAEGVVNITSSGSKDFTGPGIVSCPVEAFFLQACAATVVGNKDACSQTCPQLAAFEAYQPPLTATGDVDIPLGCDCLQALDCSSQCTFAAKNPGEIVLPTTSTTSPTSAGAPSPTAGSGSSSTSSPFVTSADDVPVASPVDKGPVASPLSNSPVASPISGGATTGTSGTLSPVTSPTTTGGGGIASSATRQNLFGGAVAVLAAVVL